MTTIRRNVVEKIAEIRDWSIEDATEEVDGYTDNQLKRGYAIPEECESGHAEALAYLTDIPGFAKDDDEAMTLHKSKRGLLDSATKG